MPLCPADEQMSSEFTPQVTKACGVFVILGLSTTFIRFLRTSPQETARRRGQRQPIALRFPLALLGRFRIRPVTQSTFVSWTGQQRGTGQGVVVFIGRNQEGRETCVWILLDFDMDRFLGASHRHGEAEVRDLLGGQGGKDAKEGSRRLPVCHRDRNAAFDRDASGRSGRRLGLVLGRRYR